MNKTYKVLSKASVCDTPTGKTFDADLPESQEKRMIERGSIEIVSGATPTDTPPETSPDAEESNETGEFPVVEDGDEFPVSEKKGK
jgi:hypothetical protein